MRPLLVLALALLAPAVRAQADAGATFAAPDGVRLWYRVAGTGDGLPAVFLHGGPGYNSHSFAVQAGPALEPHLRMVYLDQRGCGRSERPPADAYSLERLVDDVEALRVHLGVEQIVPLGHSFGGTIALEYARRYPSRVARLVLVGPLSDTPASMASWRDALRLWHPDLAATMDAAGTDGALWDAIAAAGGQRFFDRMQFVDDRRRARQDSLDAASGLANTGELSAALWAQGFGTYRTPDVERIAAPTLLVVGAHDYAIGVGAMEALAARLPAATVRRYADSAHFPYVEEPSRFAADVVAFLAAP